MSKNQKENNRISPYFKHLDFSVETENEEKSLLPLFINCKQKDLLYFLENEIVISKEPCDVMKEHIVYGFYGISHFISDDVFKKRSSGEATTCLVIDLSKCQGQIKNIFPFDTGAASGSLDEAREPIPNWEELSLGTNVNRVNKFILFYFKNLREYINSFNDSKWPGSAIKGKFKRPKKFSEFEDTENIYRDPNILDQRLHCIEFQFENVPLEPDSLFNLIVSSDLLEDMQVERERYRITKKHFYPTSLESNHEIGKAIKDISARISLSLLK